ncbi:hypothetical protein Q2308_24360, partial [Escherichia coli]|nr:hypothetical protein [Escherichia coli]
MCIRDRTEVAERLGIDIADYRQMLFDTSNRQHVAYDERREEHGESNELVTEDHQRENLPQTLLDRKPVSYNHLTLPTVC